jgi:hypothetical protein
VNRIETIKDLHDFVSNLHHQKKEEVKYSVEEYLLALWTVINKYRSEDVTGNLLARVIVEAFDVEPAEFNERWLEYNYAYSGWQKDGNQYLPYKYDAAIGESYFIKRRLSDFELLRDVILCQIADLHRMKDSSPSKLTISYQSPTGIYWRIFPLPGVFYYLLGGITQMFELNPDGSLSESDWADLAILLQFARLASD